MHYHLSTRRILAAVLAALALLTLAGVALAEPSPLDRCYATCARYYGPPRPEAGGGRCDHLGGQWSATYRACRVCYAECDARRSGPVDTRPRQPTTDPYEIPPASPDVRACLAECARRHPHPPGADLCSPERLPRTRCVARCYGTTTPCAEVRP